MIFRFRFGSDQGIETEGWAIDDFCFQQTFDAADYYVGMEESIPGVVSLGELFPNPARERVHLNIQLMERSDVAIQVHSLFGKELYSDVQSVDRGVQTLEIPTAGWAPGLYIVQFEMSGHTVVKKLVIE